MTTRRQMMSGVILGLPASLVVAQNPASVTPKLFAVEFRTGAKWDTNKEAQDQLHFREHSANLKRLREDGLLLVGARYSDKGFLVVAAATEDEVRVEFDKDPSVKAEVFRYDVHAFNVFYSGCLGTRPA